MWTTGGGEALASSLKQLAQNLHPTESECLRREEVTGAVKEALKRAFPPPSEVLACPYGSFIVSV
ncbi:hypothetical protein DUNSADRAFT_7839 [Dunaliella salina]|uniref:Uncharacterized protein n=1 Tax=Dunaliella salina TaxID=3046 RepID=A0ABQ7FT32_DUNSA|nr:hypothetical protein DUNSADRAFT_7839 [Dunaliella salina]|eukprot:KAF5825650.1 hypothetical protein DUNSADRAFT_7839 [Dunaliella salina]